MSEPKREEPQASAAPNQPAALSARVQSLRLPPGEGRTSPVPRLLPWIICGFLAVLTLFAVFQGFSVAANVESLQSSIKELSEANNKHGVAPKGKAGQHGKPMGPGVEPGKTVLTSKGYIVPFSQIQVSPKVGGMLVYLNIEEGMRVKKDAILAKIEAVDYQADHDRAVANAETAWQRYREIYFGWRPEEVAQAKAELEEAESQREQLYLAYKRSGGLKTGGAMATQEFEQSLSQFQSMDRRVEKLRLSYKLYQLGPREERVDAALSEWFQALADVRKTRWRLDNCTVRASVSGVILTKRAEEGSQVNPAAFSNGLSASLCDMADLTDMEVDLSIAERDIGRLAGFTKMKCQIRCDAFSERVYDGYISRIMPIADRAKGSVPVRVKIIIPREEEGKYLRPENSAMVEFINAEWEPDPNQAPAPVPAPQEKKAK